MADYKVLKNYKDKQLGKSLKANDKVEMTVKRAEEVEKTSSDKGYTGPFLERIKEKKWLNDYFRSCRRIQKS
mgnify:CR=1 FL=1